MNEVPFSQLEAKEESRSCEGEGDLLVQAREESKEARKGSSRSSTRHREPLRNLLEHSRVRYTVEKVREEGESMMKVAEEENDRRSAVTSDSRSLPANFIVAQSTLSN